MLAISLFFIIFGTKEGRMQGKTTKLSCLRIRTCLTPRYVFTLIYIIFSKLNRCLHDNVYVVSGVRVSL